VIVVYFRYQHARAEENKARIHAKITGTPIDELEVKKILKLQNQHFSYNALMKWWLVASSPNVCLHLEVRIQINILRVVSIESW
jgi:hypothetical protein